MVKFLKLSGNNKRKKKSTIETTGGRIDADEIKEELDLLYITNGKKRNQNQMSFTIAKVCCDARSKQEHGDAWLFLLM